MRSCFFPPRVDLWDCLSKKLWAVKGAIQGEDAYDKTQMVERQILDDVS